MVEKGFKKAPTKQAGKRANPKTNIKFLPMYFKV